MRVKLTLDDLPDPIIGEADTLEEAFAEICDKLVWIHGWDPPAATVKIVGKDGRDVTNEFNEFWAEY